MTGAQVEKLVDALDEFVCERVSLGSDDDDCGGDYCSRRRAETRAALVAALSGPLEWPHDVDAIPADRTGA